MLVKSDECSFIICCFEHFHSLLPLTKHAILYDVCNVKLQIYAKGLAFNQGGGGGESTSKYLFSISYNKLNSRNRVFIPHF